MKEIAKNQKNEGLFVNDNIPFLDLLLINVDGEKEYITKQEALKRAETLGLDLICVAPDQVPPACKLDDYQKFVYRIKKKKKKTFDKGPKKITFTFNINENDLIFKVEHICKWIKEGMIVKVMLKLVGKEKEQLEIAKQKCYNIINHLQLKETPKMSFRGEKDGFYRENNYLYFFVQKEK